MVERMHRTLKDALTAANKRDWVAEMPWVLLQMRNAASKDISYTPAEITFGGNTRRPADLVAETDTAQPNTLAELMRDWIIPDPEPGRWHTVTPTNDLKDKDKITSVFVRVKSRRPLRNAYMGPFKVIKWTDKTVTIMYEGKPDTVSIDRIKPVKTFNNKLFFHFPDLDAKRQFLDD